MHEQQITLAFVTICDKSGGADTVNHRGRGNLDGDVIRVWTGYACSGGIPRGVRGSIGSVRTSCRGHTKRELSNIV